MHACRLWRFFCSMIALGLGLALPLSVSAADKKNGAQPNSLKPVTQERLLRGTMKFPARG